MGVMVVEFEKKHVLQSQKVEMYPGSFQYLQLDITRQ